jgi:hypothetical protein
MKESKIKLENEEQIIFNKEVTYIPSKVWGSFGFLVITNKNVRFYPINKILQSFGLIGYYLSRSFFQPSTPSFIIKLEGIDNFELYKQGFNMAVKLNISSGESYVIAYRKREELVAELEKLNIKPKSTNPAAV